MSNSLESLPSEEQQLRRAGARVGELVGGRWRLDSLIGLGGMASVYSATHRNGMRVAIKMLHPELSADAEIKQRFIDEGYVSNRVKHAGTPSVLDDGETTEGLFFLVMDLLEGQTLEERLLQRKTLRPRQVLAFAGALLDVLAAAHDQGIVHRDIKPANIFLTHGGAVRLLDFGIAQVAAPRQARMTQHGVSMGTPAYMAPEQARGHWDEVDGRTDIWAVGATMFTALVGEPFHAGDTTNEELLSAMTRRAPSLQDALPGAPKQLVELVDRALAFDPGDRWADPRSMHAALCIASAELDSRAVQVALDDRAMAKAGMGGKPFGSRKAVLTGRAMWNARTHSWCVLPSEPARAPSFSRRIPWLRRGAIWAGVAAFGVAFVGRVGPPSPSRADSSSVPVRLATARPASPMASPSLAVAGPQGSGAPAPVVVPSANEKRRDARLGEHAPRLDENKVPKGSLDPPMAPRQNPVPPPETDPLERRR